MDKSEWEKAKGMREAALIVDSIAEGYESGSKERKILINARDVIFVQANRIEVAVLKDLGVK